MVALKFHQYQVVGRALPKDAEDTPKIYRMKLWHTNDVRAKSKFWYFLKKVKKSNGQIVAINEILEKKPTVVENYGIWLRYQSRTGYHNMYKEYRDTTLNGAVDQMCTEMASRHRVRFPCIQIIETATIVLYNRIADQTMSSCKLTNLCIVAALLLFLSLTSTAREMPSSPDVSTMKVQPEDAQVEKVMAEESCEGVGEEECLMRRTLAAHIDYIYTQKNNP
ncbi:hypothetical protein ABKV19_008902 [Rosa sericea]